MTILQMLYTLFIGPIELIFEVIYFLSYKFIGNPGLCIVSLSLIMNLLILPLYMRADAIQEEERLNEKRLSKGVAHIKKAFKGDERMMMLQTYYRQNNYKPVYALKSAISLLLEIPFFIAAYNFLSELKLIQGVSFGPIENLGKPDALIVIAGVSINILPIIMTAVNVVSTIIFTKDQPIKSKIQLFAFALAFLVILYKSPSGLVFYWTLNNLFSLVKTIFYKIPNPKKTICALVSISGILLIILSFFVTSYLKYRICIIVIGVLLQLPILLQFNKCKSKVGRIISKIPAGHPLLFTFGGILLSVMTGLLIPSAVISASPQEFVDITYFYHPVWYIVSSTLLSFGMFVIWFGVFYRLSKPKLRFCFDAIICGLCGIAIIDYFIFGKNQSIISSSLQFDVEPDFSTIFTLVNIGVVILVFAALSLLYCVKRKILLSALIVGSTAILGMSIFNCYGIFGEISEINTESQTSDSQPSIELSKDGNNVIVIMLDKAMGEYVPYIFNEKSELNDQFSGFTYYSNTISYGPSTNFATPALFGGYEYTPEEINKRDTEELKDKHNEALKVMPAIFYEEGYDVTVCDLPYANYKEISDYSIFDEYPEIKAFNTAGIYSSDEIKMKKINSNLRCFFCYSVMKISPIAVQGTIYSEGSYNIESNNKQYVHNKFLADGQNSSFLYSYNVLENMKNMTSITSESTNTFSIFVNNTTHDTMMLQEPEYEPKDTVDNTSYEQKNEDRFENSNNTLKHDTAAQLEMYQSNVAAYLQLGKWFDYLKAEGVYDNTRIIVVSDHGYRYLDQLDAFKTIEYEGLEISTENFYPLLMVKDFNQTGAMTTSTEFMTNADVPSIATKELIENATNPFTEKKLDESENKDEKQYVFLSTDWQIQTNNGKTFNPGKWLSVIDDIWKKDNWAEEKNNSTLPY